MAKHWTQKLKEKNLQLQRDLRTLVLEPDSLKAVDIKTRVHFESDLEKSVWFGDANKI